MSNIGLQIAGEARKSSRGLKAGGKPCKAMAQATLSLYIFIGVVLLDNKMADQVSD